MNERFDLSSGISPLMTAAEVESALPQKGRAKVVDRILHASDNGLIADKFLDVVKDPHLFEERIYNSRKKPLTEMFPGAEQYYRFPPEAEQFQGHFPGRPIMPGHELIGLMHQLIIDAIKAPVVVERISALFKAPILPNARVGIKIDQITVERNKVFCRAEAFNVDTEEQVCALRIFEGHVETLTSQCSAHKLIEMACQAATMFQYCKGSLDNPIALTAVDARFFKAATTGGKISVSIFDPEIKRAGIVSCKADLTDGFGRVIAMVDKLNGVSISAL